MWSAFSLFPSLKAGSLHATVILTKVCGETGGQADACTYVLIGNPKQSLPLQKMLE